MLFILRPCHTEWEIVMMGKIYVFMTCEHLYNCTSEDLITELVVCGLKTMCIHKTLLYPSLIRMNDRHMLT